MEESIILLFQNNERLIITPELLKVKSIDDIYVKSLIKYIYLNWDSNGNEAPESIYQIRLIHLGKTLGNDLNFESFENREEIHPASDDENEGLKLNELNLNVSNIIHVSLKPIESIKKIKKKNARKSNARSRSASIKQSKVLSADEEENVNSKSGCCIIV